MRSEEVVALGPERGKVGVGEVHARDLLAVVRKREGVHAPTLTSGAMEVLGRTDGLLAVDDPVQANRNVTQTRENTDQDKVGQGERLRLQQGLQERYVEAGNL